MDYWEEVMSDDFYQIALYGWLAEPYRIIEIINKGKKKGQKKDVGWTCDLLPKALLVSHAFANQQKKIDLKQEEFEITDDELNKIEEERSADGDVFSDFDKVNKKEVKKRIKEIVNDPEFVDDLSVLNDWVEKTKKKDALKKEIKELDETLDKEVLGLYPKLSESEIKDIVIHNKWLANLEVKIANNNRSVLEKLSSRLKQLSERYETPLPALKQKTEKLSNKVEKHFKSMGYNW